MFKLHRSKWLGILLACLLISGIVFPSMHGLAVAQDRDDDKKDEEKQNGESESISEEDAAELAIQALREQYGEADYIIIESKYDDGEYIFIIKVDDKIYQVEVDAESGSVKDIEEEDLEEEEKEQGEDEVLQNTTLIARENITRIAINYLNETYGKQNYTVIEIELDGEEYEVEATNGTDTFVLKIDARSGEILSTEVEKEDRDDNQEKDEEKEEEENEKDEKDEDEIEEEEKEDEDEKGEDEEEERSVTPEISVEEASSIAIGFLTANYGEANYTVMKIELDDGEYEVKVTDGISKFELVIDAETGSIIESEAEEIEEEEKEILEQAAISMQEAIEIAQELLIQQFGEGNYTVTEVEFDDGEFEIEMRDDAGGEYEFKIDATTGSIVEFEGKTRELKVEIEKEDEDELKVEIEEKDLEEEKKGFKVEVKKKEPKFKLEFKVKENVTKTDLELELLFDSLIEYLDNGTSVGIFDANDTIIATVDLSELQWSISRSEKTGNNDTITAITINQIGTGDKISNITFIYHLTPTTRTISLTNEAEATVKVWEVKFDIHMEGYNWTRTNSSLALSGTFNTEFEVKLEGEEEIKFKAIDGITPFFSWGGEAVADGATIEVTADATKNRVTLSYPHFNNSLTHDPRIGYLIPTALPPIEVLVPMVLIIGGAAVATILAVTSIVRSRRLRKEILKLPGGLVGGQYVG